MVVFVAAISLAYVAYHGSKASSFFEEVVKNSYDLRLPDDDIDDYYELKDRLQERLLELKSGRAGSAEARPVVEEPEAGVPVALGPGSTMGFDDAAAASDDTMAASLQGDLWVRELSAEERMMLKRQLVKRLVADIERLDQVQRDKPGNWKLWRGKLVSEPYWVSLCEAEKRVSEEIDACLEEAESLEAGWREHIFPQAVQCWRVGKARESEKKEAKKAVEKEKKKKVVEEKKKEVEARLAEEQKLKQERLAEKAMEQLLREEETQAKVAKSTKSGKAAATKPKPKKK